VSVKLLGLDEAQAALKKLGRERMNIAIAAGVNRTAVQMERKLKVEMVNKLDRPTPFTLNAVRVWKAERNKLRATVYVQRIQASYLRYAIQGGRLPTILEPIQVRTDRHGNIRGKRGGMQKIAGMGRNRFVATINGTTGVWQRHGPKGRKLKLLVKSSENKERRPRWDFFGIGERVARERLQSDVREAIQREISAL
jgi:hypothetical protein